MRNDKTPNKRYRSIRKLLWFILLFIAVCVIAVIACDMAVNNSAKGRVYTEVNKTPPRKVGLLLGTSPIGRSGNPNQFFIRRIEATARLYKAGKFNRLIISGANRPEEFNEPKEMRDALVRKGVPDSIMVLDGEGFRTISSIKRARDVYGADSILIISQAFHNERALFLAKHKGIDAIAFNAANTSSRRWRIQMKIRECLARVKAVLEVVGI